MREILLTKGYVALVDDDDYERVMAAGPWFALVDTHTVYAVRHVRGDRGLGIQHLHRFLLGATERQIQVDHADRNGLNNCRGNIRLCSPSQNNANRIKAAGKSSVFKGVSWHKRARKWRADIMVQGQQYYLGLFADENAASAAYCVAARKHFGAFMRAIKKPRHPRPIGA